MFQPKVDSFESVVFTSLSIEKIFAVQDLARGGLVVVIVPVPLPSHSQPLSYKTWGTSLCLSVFRNGDIIVLIAIPTSLLLVVYVDDVSVCNCH